MTPNLHNIHAEQKIKQAKVSLLISNVFFGSLAMRLKFKQDLSCPTAWTDGIYLGYNPDYIESLSMSLVKSVLAHEVMHLALSHQARRQNRDHKIFNDAGDYVINDLIKDAGFRLADEWLYESRFHDMTTEAVYKILYSESDDGSSGQSGQSQGQGQGQGQSQGQSPDFDPAKHPGEVRDAPPSDPNSVKASPEDMAKSEIDWTIAARQAAQQAKAIGKLPGHLEDIIIAQTKAKVNWREQLRDFMTDKAQTDYSWRVPNRRYTHMGLYLPGLDSEDELCEAMFYTDVSGSVSTHELEAGATEVNGILEEFPNIRLTGRYFDTEVKDDTLTFGGDDLPVEMHFKDTGGGTDFRPIFKDVQEIKPDLKFLVIFSDMRGSFPSEHPPYPVLWVNVGYPGETAPFGTVIHVELD